MNTISIQSKSERIKIEFFSLAISIIKILIFSKIIKKEYVQNNNSYTLDDL